MQTFSHRAGVIGHPVSHSLSPLIHRFWLKENDLEGDYLTLAVEPPRLGQALADLTAAGFRGVNVTIPHKVAVLDHCTTLDSSAVSARSANTLVFSASGEIRGYNSDGFGFLQSARAAGIDLSAGPLLILGAGGAARGIAAAAAADGIEVWLAARNRNQADLIVQFCPKLKIVDWPGLPLLPGRATLVNASAGGMLGQTPLDLSLNDVTSELAVIDIVYSPLETDLLRQARARNFLTVDGLEMLIHQASLAFFYWFGLMPKVTEGVRSELIAHIK